MTLSEVSFRNARRQARDYLIYFATVILAAALLYAFNGLVFSREVRELSGRMDNIPVVIGLSSAVVVCVFGWLVSYTTDFMLARRSRELGTYLLIGLTNRQVARLFFLENLAVGGAALILGVALGGLLFQVLWAVVLALFGQHYRFGLSLSLPALGLTLLYFCLIYLRALGRSRRRIRRMKICDLFRYRRQNQEAVVKSGRIRRWVLVLAPLLAAAGTVFLLAGDFLTGVTGAGLIIAGLYGFFLSLASGVPAWFERRPARKYAGQNLLVFRTLTAKLSTMGVVMATISMLLTATVILQGSGMVFRGVFLGRAAENACFDLFVSLGSSQRTLDEYLGCIGEQIPVERSLAYAVYCSGTTEPMDYLGSRSVRDYGYDDTPAIRYSDYAVLRELAGYPPAAPEPGQYLIHCRSYLGKAMENFRRPLTVGGVTLEAGGVYTEHFIQQYNGGNGNSHLLIIPDEAAEGLPLHHLAYAAATARPVGEDEFCALTAINDANYGRYLSATSVEGTDGVRIPVPDDFVTTRAYEQAEAAAMTALTALPLCFLALALTMTAATILTVQQLSESDRLRQQFGLLRKLGMDRREMEAALTKQLTVYYALPALPPVLMGVPFLLNLAGIPEPGVMVGMNSPAAIVAVTCGAFALVYGVYILLCRVSLRRSVLP